MASKFQGRRILVVEDEPLITFLLEDTLMIAGAQTVVQAARVADGRSALPVADRLAELGVPFVFATGLDPSAVNKGEHATAPVITKPYNPEEVVSCLAGLMGEVSAS
jgi:predicted metal-dependent phosphotriesterase family hydrolase